MKLGEILQDSAKRAELTPAAASRLRLGWSLILIGTGLCGRAAP